MLLQNLYFVVSLILLLVTSRGAGNDTTQKLTGRCRENERQALLDFKAHTLGESGMLSSWGTDNEQDCCKWQGIRCSNLTGHVTDLNLAADHLKYRLTGIVSPSLSELQQLKYLNLSHNYFMGEIPPQLGNLTNLCSLDLRYNEELTVKTLEWVSNLHMLTHLDLSFVDLRSCSGWLDNISKLSSLTHLHLRQCNLPRYNPSFPSANASFISLSAVDLSYNFFISPRSCSWLFNFTRTLSYLDLSHNTLSRIPEAFGRMISLESLLLSKCELRGMLPDSFRNLSRLATLDLTYNYLNGSLYDFLHPLATKVKNSLQVLKLNVNKLDGSLPNYFTRFPHLREMSISNNKLSGSFPDNFWQLSFSLVHLDLSNNQLTGSFPNLALFSSLETLILRNNKLADTVPEAYLSNLSKLSHLDLSSNSLSLKFGLDFVPSFQLHTILLRNCTLGPHFPNWIKSQRSCSMLDISQAKISDTIPLWFWDLSPTLKNLNMSKNQIEGILPNLSHIFADVEWLDLSYNFLQGALPTLPVQLVYLDLAHNMFTGSLPFRCICQYPELYYIHLSYNKLSGTLVTKCLTNSYQLSTLYLGDNDFSGNIPTSIGLLDQLAILQLRNNNFTGRLPLSMINITNLQLLDLSGNKLSGNVPSWIGTCLTSLVILTLRDNEFSGSIPPQLCHLRNAQVLDLSKNNLTGSIPNCIDNITSLAEKETNVDTVVFKDIYGPKRYPMDRLAANVGVQWKGIPSEYERTLKYLKLIDISSNKLVGEIPEAFASLKGLISLNLSFNSLTGNIIPKISQMENLENLDLSRNHLSGIIPSGLASLTLLSALDLSNNNLEGEIPTSTQLQSFDPSKYAGNEQLCGLPLPNKCRREHSPLTGHDDKDESNEEADDKDPKFWMYATAVLGFVTGFWGFIGPGILRRSWRHSYYKFLGSTIDFIYIKTILLMTRLSKKFTTKRSI